MYNFHVGQKVVCVSVPEVPDGLIIGGQYHIRWIGDDPVIGALSIKLREITRPLVYPWDDEPGYRATRFRPLVTTDISIFQAMLSPTPVKHKETEHA